MQNKIRDRSSTTIHRSSSLNHVLTQQGKATQKTWMATLVMSLGLAGGLWLTIAAHVPQITHAQTASFDVTIDRQPNESYENLVKRAEAAAREALANNFARNREAKDVSLTVVAHDRGAIAPVLNLKVSRDRQYNSNADGGITYFQQARSLLRFDEDLATTPANTPGSRSNTNSRSGLQPRFTNPTTPRSSQNADPGTVKQGVGGNNTFSQPPSRQPINTNPSSSFSGSTGTSNPGTFTGGSPSPTGTNVTPQLPNTINVPSQPSTTPSTGTGLTPQSPSTTPLNSPNQPSTSTSTTGTSLTPQSPSTNQPLLSPTSPNSTNSTNPVTSPTNSGSTNTTAPGIVPAAQQR